MQLLEIVEEHTDYTTSLSDKRARAHEVMRAEARDMMLRASSERERDEIRTTYQRRHAMIDSETEDRCGGVVCWCFIMMQAGAWFVYACV